MPGGSDTVKRLPGVALARIAEVRYYPSDVLAGILLGAGIGGATAYASRRVRQGGPGTTSSPA